MDPLCKHRDYMIINWELFRNLYSIRVLQKQLFNSPMLLLDFNHSFVRVSVIYEILYRGFFLPVCNASYYALQNSIHTKSVTKFPINYKLNK